MNALTKDGGTMYRTLLVLIVLMCAAPAALVAAEAKAVWVDASCRYFVADLGGEFGFYNWVAGMAPNEGDVLEGELRAEGVTELANKSSGGKNSVVVFALSPTVRSLVQSAPADCKRRWERR